ncbi:MAG TPA: polysaccharide biosynthesis/export family protein [Pirellulales bacterium]|nr:polysaccharide biosynthesis/export family protein [Pirellulales bacterium]
MPVQRTAPRELTKVILPPYRIEPPDILQIDAIRVVPKFPYHLRILDSLVLQVTNALPDAPISGTFVIDPGGTINLGNPYGVVSVAGKTVEEAQQAIAAQLKQTLREPVLNVSLGEIASKQQVAGQHLVAQDGTVTLGSYGNVEVVGQTVAEAKASIESYLSQTLQDPEVSVEVFAYNSKNYYIITQGAGLGDGVTRYPITGNDTVLDAIAQISGFTSVSSTKIWVARPGHTCEGHDQILPVDWCAISQRGDATTNYQLLPGDRVYVAEDKLVSLDNCLAKIISPIERVFGITLLGSSTVFNLKNGGNGNNGGGF